jgi:hypothetical protein
MYYIFDLETGLPVPEPDIGKAAAFKEKHGFIARTDLASCWVSTVFLVHDHGWGEGEGVIVFETMVFPHDSMSEMYCDRYTNRADALAGHQSAVDQFMSDLERIVVGVSDESD